MRKKNEGHGERQLMNKLHDGASCWIMTSTDRLKNEGKENRQNLLENALSILAFAQPQPFIEMYRPLAGIRDGFVDQLLVCPIKPKIFLEEVLTVSFSECLNVDNYHEIRIQILIKIQILILYNINICPYVLYFTIYLNCVDLSEYIHQYRFE